MVALWCKIQGLLAQKTPSLQKLRVFGKLPSGKRLQVPFDPPFNSRDFSTLDFLCKLDNAMDYFSLEINARAPGVISELLQDEMPVVSRRNLTHVRLGAGARMVFEISATDGETRRYTVVVVRRRGSSLELLGLRPTSATYKNMSIPFHPGELQEEFEVDQSFHEDFFIVEYDFADGGQRITCQVDGSATIGNNLPTEGQMALHPYKYIPSLEQLQRVEEEPFFNLNSPGAGPTCRCHVPIDSWRRIKVGLHIHAADKVSHRVLWLIVERKGCETGTFYHKGSCRTHCPTYYYEQSFNWRCGKCNQHCEFCVHWHHCIRCERNTTMYRYEHRVDGTCRQVRVHVYKIYYDLARYLGFGCGCLIVIYLIIVVVCLCTRPLQKDVPVYGEVSRFGNAGHRAEAARSEERQPLAGWKMHESKNQMSVGVGGLFEGRLSPAE